MSYRQRSSRKFSLGLIASAGLAASLVSLPAVAADLDYGYGAEPPVLPETKVEFGSGWYIRGDIAATRGLTPKASDGRYDPTPECWACNTKYQVVTPRGAVEGPGLSPPSIISDGSHNFAYGASIGGGYQFNRWFRADLTFDWLQPKKNTYAGQSRECITGLVGVPPGAAPSDVVPTTTMCTPTNQASLNSYDALVNGYIDLGTWSIVTPYVGAGIGLSFGNASASSTYVMNNTLPYQITFNDPRNGATYYQNWDRKSSIQYYNFAYALMAGVAFDVYDHTKLDIGYRYLNLGKVLGQNLQSQEVRAGLRYMIDN